MMLDSFADIIMGIDPEELAHLSDDQRLVIAGDISSAEAALRAGALNKSDGNPEKRKMWLIKGALELRKRLARGALV